jgi:cell wall-associated NlpC family hydrolase
MKNIPKILSAIALISAITMSGCSVASSIKNNVWEESGSVEEGIVDDNNNGTDNEDDNVASGDNGSGGFIVDDENNSANQTPDNETEGGNNSGNTENNSGNADTSGGNNSAGNTDNNVSEPPQTTTTVTQPTKNTITYIKVTADSVNIRSGAGTSYSSLGTAEKNTLYAYLGTVGSWYKTYYKNSTVYISSKYCVMVEMIKSDNDLVESVIKEGTKCLGVKYVYGATRYHDGNGNLLSGFKNTAFDCSSLMQYIFYKGAKVNLQVNTRTQIYQGTTIKKSALKRGDLIFFTNESRKNNTGIERVGHVALYLGDNLILHTASDYAKIEEVSNTRWGYYIQTQRMI